MSVFLRVSEGKVSILRVRVKKGVLRVRLGCQCVDLIFRVF